LKKTQQEIARLGLDTIMSTRLCMLGVSLCVLPKELFKPLSIEQLEQLAQQLRERGMGVKITSIGS